MSIGLGPAIDLLEDVDLHDGPFSSGRASIFTSHRSNMAAALHPRPHSAWGSDPWSTHEDIGRLGRRGMIKRARIARAEASKRAFDTYREATA